MDGRSEEKKRTREKTEELSDQGPEGANTNGFTDISDKDGGNGIAASAADGASNRVPKSKRRNLGRVDAGDEELLLADGVDDVDDLGNVNTTANDQTGEDTDDVVVLSCAGIATRPMTCSSAGSASAGGSPGGDDGDFSDVEIISARQTPDVVASVETWEGRGSTAASGAPGAQDADVSVELLEDWFGPASARDAADGAGIASMRQNIAVDDTDESDGGRDGDGDDDDDDDDDDLVMLDGKPTMSTDQLLDQIKEKDGTSATSGLPAPSPAP
ncbi:hypothetical protein PMKS-002245 [Pichia membranifaciens]|uniref:Uncharacterized protein n=1 Tax=Pichia membranifaciens TaxID=4926 RepID=A0A1Q2YGS3_9ASCO|nr:hypothetical protein PMKS-002245 [Pichia membranifaciens]